MSAKNIAVDKRATGEGFTRIELLVVITTLAVLAGSLLSAVSMAKAKGTLVFCLNNQISAG
jgi:type II secretory pathway pseudopilin PulG